MLRRIGNVALWTGYLLSTIAIYFGITLHYQDPDMPYVVTVAFGLIPALIGTAIRYICEPF
jgi:hypothetical protein